MYGAECYACPTVGLYQFSVNVATIGLSNAMSFELFITWCTAIWLTVLVLQVKLFKWCVVVSGSQRYFAGNAVARPHQTFVCVSMTCCLGQWRECLYYREGVCVCE